MTQEMYIYHPDDVMQGVECKLDELKPFQYDSRYRKLLGDAFVRKISQWERDIRNRKNDPFTLVVCGEFKRGKSSLINAILGEDVAPTNVLPETVTLNRISYGIHSNEAILSGGRRLKLADEDLQKEKLEAIMARTGEPIRRLELQRPIELLKNIAIVDTPGLNDDTFQDFSELVEYSLRQADAVIYVFNINSPLSRTEQLFLKTEILPQKYTDLFLIANYCDTFRSKEDLERMQQMLHSRINGLLPGHEPILLSALDERCLQCGEERPNPQLQDIFAQNFANFRKQLENLIGQKQYMVIPDRMRRLLRAMAEDLGALLDSTEDGLNMSEQDIRQRVADVTQACQEQEAQQAQLHSLVSDQIRRMRQECSMWMTEMLNRMEQELDSFTGISAEDLIRYYSFYCIDLAQEGMDRCIEHHTEQLYDILDDISFELTKVLGQKSESKQYNFRFALNNQTWTKGDNVSFAGYMVERIGLASVSLIVDGIAGAMRQKEMKDRTPELILKIREQYRMLRSSVDASVDATYEKLGKLVLSQLQDYHRQQIVAAKDRVEQSALVARQSAAQKEEIRQIIAQLRGIMADIDRVE